MRKFAMAGLSASCLLGLALLALSPSGAAFVQTSDSCPRSQCGEVSPLIPMQSTEAVHMGLVWKRGSNTPQILFHARFPEYIPNDVADPAVVDAAIADGKLTNGRNDFNASPRATFKQLT